MTVYLKARTLKPGWDAAKAAYDLYEDDTFIETYINGENTQTAGVQEAINYLNASGGGTLVFDEGTFVLSTYATIPGNITIQGKGKYSTIITAAQSFTQWNGNRPAFFVITGSEVEISNIGFETDQPIHAIYSPKSLQDISIHDIYAHYSGASGSPLIVFFEALGTTFRSKNIEFYNFEAWNYASFNIYSNGLYGYENVNAHDLLDIVDNAASDDRWAFVASDGGYTMTSHIYIYNLTLSNARLLIRSTASGTVNGLKFDAATTNSGYTFVYTNVNVNNIQILVENGSSASGQPVLSYNNPGFLGATISRLKVYSLSTSYGNWFYLSCMAPNGGGIGVDLTFRDISLMGGSVPAHFGIFNLYETGAGPQPQDKITISDVYIWNVSGANPSAVVNIDVSGGPNIDPNLVILKNIYAYFNGTGNYVLMAGYNEGGAAIGANSQIIMDGIYYNGDLFNFASPNKTKVVMKNVRSFGNIYNAPSTPSVPASGTAQQNTNPYTVEVALYGGTVTEITITRNGTTYTVFSNSSGAALSGQTYRLDPNDSITLTYTTAPTWTWLPA